jgi:hypothetical protein
MTPEQEQRVRENLAALTAATSVTWEQFTADLAAAAEQVRKFGTCGASPSGSPPPPRS